MDAPVRAYRAKVVFSRWIEFHNGAAWRREFATRENLVTSASLGSASRCGLWRVRGRCVGRCSWTGRRLRRRGGGGRCRGWLFRLGGCLICSDRPWHRGRLEVRATPQQCLDSFDQQVRRGLVDFAAETCGTESIRQLRIAAIQRKQEKGQLRSGAVNHSRYLHTRHLRHAEINDDDVRFKGSRFFNGFQAIYGLATDFPSSVHFEHFARAAARLWVVVCNKNSSHSSSAGPWGSLAMFGILHCVVPDWNTVVGV